MKTGSGLKDKSDFVVAACIIGAKYLKLIDNYVTCIFMEFYVFYS